MFVSIICICLIISSHTVLGISYEIVEATFASTQRSFTDDTPDLEEILQCPYENMDMRMLGSALFEQGFLSTRRRSVKHTCGNLGLGDTGYMTEHNNFVVVGSISNLILSTYSKPPSHFPDISGDIWYAGLQLESLQRP